MKRIILILSVIFVVACTKKAQDPTPLNKYGYRIIQDSENKPNDTVRYTISNDDINYHAVLKMPLNRSVDTFMTFYSNSKTFEIETYIEKNKEGGYRRNDNMLAPDVYIQIHNAHVNYFIEYKSF